MSQYLIPFLTSFLLTAILIGVFIWAGKKIKWRGRISCRHIHKDGVLRIGGLAMVAAFIIAIFLNRDLVMTPELFGFMAGALIFLLVGIWDDIKEIFWKIQFFFQIAVAALVFIVGVRIICITNLLTGGVINLESGWLVILSAALVIFWIVLITNTINWIDGIDGLSSGIAFIAVITMFFLSLRPEVNQPPVAILCAILAGAFLSFLIFNFYPSKALAGTSGAMFMGFSLAILAIFSGAKIATAILVLAVPLIDFLWVIGERIKKGQSIFKPDKNHLHHKLLELGWTQKKIVLGYWTVTLIIAAVSLNVRGLGKIFVLLITAVIMVSALLWINKKIAILSRGKKQCPKHYDSA